MRSCEDIFEEWGEEEHKTKRGWGELPEINQEKMESSSGAKWPSISKLGNFTQSYLLAPISFILPDIRTGWAMRSWHF